MKQSKKTESLQGTLASIINDYGSDLPVGNWSSEKDRWQELLVCMINQVKPEPNMDEVREVTEIWEKLNLTSPMILSALKEDDREYSFLVMTLLQYDFTEHEALTTVNMAIALGKAVADNYNGKIQTCIRKYAVALRDELTKTFADVGLDDSQINYGVVHWLQNTMNAPLSLSHQSVTAFCKEKGVTPQELWNAADILEINLAVIDDVLERRAFVKSFEVNPDMENKK